MKNTCHPRQQQPQRLCQPPSEAGRAPIPADADGPFAFDAWMWRYLRTEFRGNLKETSPTAPRRFDDDEVEDELALAWEFLKARKYQQAWQQCQDALKTIERHLAQDFAQDLTALTLFEDADAERRECYLATLDVYQHVLVSQIAEILSETDDLQDIDPQYARYRKLRQHIQREISKVAYLLGEPYDSAIFLTNADLPQFDDLVRRHCQYVLKTEFFTAFTSVIRTIGPLDRRDFHLMTEPYKSLRDQCARCLDITARMRDERFFGPEDVFIENYEHDVKLYLQVLWYLGLKSDLNKVDKLLHPNTYSGGLDAQMQVFDTIELLHDARLHLQEARAIGLGDLAAADILETYAEHWYVILNYEAAELRGDTAQRAANAARSERFDALKAMLEQYTVARPKTRLRVDFAYRFLPKTPLAFRLQDHKLIEEPNPDGRMLKDPGLAAEFLDALNTPLLAECVRDLRLQYRSRGGVKRQHLRWTWVAERALPAGFFDQPHYNYLAYINDRWPDKVAGHDRLLRQLLQRDDD